MKQCETRLLRLSHLKLTITWEGNICDTLEARKHTEKKCIAS